MRKSFLLLLLLKANFLNQTQKLFWLKRVHKSSILVIILSSLNVLNYQFLNNYVITFILLISVYWIWILFNINYYINIISVRCILLLLFLFSISYYNHVIFISLKSAQTFILEFIMYVTTDYPLFLFFFSIKDIHSSNDTMTRMWHIQSHDKCDSYYNICQEFLTILRSKRRKLIKNSTYSILNFYILINHLVHKL